MIWVLVIIFVVCLVLRYPIAFALGCNASFVARSMDRDPKHLKAMLHRSHAHKGTSLLEIYQNCNIFNDGAFFEFTDKATKADRALFVTHGEPLVFGGESQFGIRINGLAPEVVNLNDGKYTKDDLWVHDETDINKANALARFFDDPDFPRPFGVIYAKERPTYDEMALAQVDEVKETLGAGDLDALLEGGMTWEIE